MNPLSFSFWYDSRISKIMKLDKEDLVLKISRYCIASWRTDEVEERLRTYDKSKLITIYRKIYYNELSRSKKDIQKENITNREKFVSYEERRNKNEPR